MIAVSDRRDRDQATRPVCGDAVGLVRREPRQLRTKVGDDRGKDARRPVIRAGDGQSHLGRLTRGRHSGAGAPPIRSRSRSTAARAVPRFPPRITSDEMGLVVRGIWPFVRCAASPIATTTATYRRLLTPPRSVARRAGVPGGRDPMSAARRRRDDLTMQRRDGLCASLHGSGRGGAVESASRAGSGKCRTSSCRPTRRTFWLATNEGDWGARRNYLDHGGGRVAPRTPVTSARGPQDD